MSTKYTILTPKKQTPYIGYKPPTFPVRTITIYYEESYLHVVSSFSCIPVICLKLVLFLIPLKFVYLLVSIKCVFRFYLQILSKTFLILRLTERDK